MFWRILTAALLGIVIGGPICPVQSVGNITMKLRTLQLDRICGYNLKGSVSLRKLKGAWNSADFGEFPWTAAILGKTGDDEIHICDGSLIHPQVILTAASCAKNLSPGRHFIRVGATDPQSNPINKPQDRVVDHKIIHKDFNEKTMENDVALLWFHNSINIYADNVDLVCLPSTNQEFDDKKCQISILDRSSEDASDESDDSEETNYKIHSTKSDGKTFDLSIKKVELEIVDSKKCDVKYAKGTICAKSPARLHVCEAKIGSSIVCQHANDPTRWVQAGTVAFTKCDDPYEKKADPYVNIAESAKWIKSQLRELREKGDLVE